MLMVCQGPACGVVFEAARPFAKYHDKVCSNRASRAGQLGQATPAPDGSRAGQVLGGPGRRKRQPVNVASQMAQMTAAELEKAGRMETSSGQAALVLARRIDAGGAETGAALAALVREHAASMDRALADEQPANPVTARQDEVARRREQHQASAR